jgi:hypothetical protein
LGDWALNILVSLLVGVPAGLGMAMAWFKGSKTRIYERIVGMEVLMARHGERTDGASRDFMKITSEHDAQLRVLTNSLGEIKNTLHRQNEKMDKQDEKLDELVREKRGR